MVGWLESYYVLNFGKVDMSVHFGSSWLARKFSEIIFWRDAGLGQPGVMHHLLHQVQLRHVWSGSWVCKVFGACTQKHAQVIRNFCRILVVA